MAILPFGFDSFVEFVQMQTSGELTSNHAKIVMKEMLESGKTPQQIREEKQLKPVDTEQLKTWIHDIFVAQPELLADLKAGNMKPM
ncbi:MAG: hypothetical protein H6765_07740 [Candidatus Peribacteria bacterium]|nr:MAG: hypothetical protein H6765_07740 [Candidatus Peribacteria bacterium]